MHKDAREHWRGSDGIRCYGCTAKAEKEQAAAKHSKTRPGAFFVARPDKAMVHAMTDPILTYPTNNVGGQVGATGIDYSRPDE